MSDTGWKNESRAKADGGQTPVSGILTSSLYFPYCPRSMSLQSHEGLRLPLSMSIMSNPTVVQLQYEVYYASILFPSNKSKVFKQNIPLRPELQLGSPRYTCLSFFKRFPIELYDGSVIQWKVFAIEFLEFI